MVILAHQSGAAVIYVNASRTGIDPGDGTSWATAFQSVTEAITPAESGDQIWIAAGVYEEQIILKPGVALYGGFHGGETSLSERNWEQNRSILDGQSSGSVIVVEPGADVATRIDGLVIRNGKGEAGGGIQSINASPTIANNWIRDNAATNAGGGIYLANSTALISSNRIESNRVLDSFLPLVNGGGGITSSNGAPQITGNQILFNYAVFGEGIRCWSDSAAIEGNTFVANRSSEAGGAIESAFSSSRIEANRFFGNAATNGMGGGLFALGEGNKTIRGNLLLGNHSKGAGAAVNLATDPESELLLLNNTMLGNESGDGPAVAFGGVPFLAANNLIAFGSGGVQAPSGGAWLNNGLFGNDTANYTGGIGDQTGTGGNIAADPMIGWSRDTADFHLQPGSPCIDAGTADGLTLGVEDIDGKVRLFGSAVDIGADELGTEPVEWVSRIIRVTATGDDIRDGSSWNDSKRTIQSALNEAAVFGGEVWVAEGSYNGPLHLRPLVKLFGGFDATETLREERDMELNPTLLDGGGSTNVVVAEYLDIASEINGFTVQNGRAEQGAGLRLLQVPIRVANNRILNCASDRPILGSGNLHLYAGGAGIRGNGASPSIINNIFARNSSPGYTLFGRLHAGGGAISLTGGKNAVIVHNTFVQNSNHLDFGAISLFQPGTEVRNNILASGTGGVTSPEPTTVLLQNNAFFGNDTNHLTGTSALFADPEFLDDQATFFLNEISPMRNAAQPLSGQSEWTDVYGRPRIADGIADLGAVEMQPDDGVLPVSPVPEFTIELAGGLTYLRYTRETMGNESGDLLPVPVIQDNSIQWKFEVARDTSTTGAPASYNGTILLGALEPGSYQFQPWSWGVPLNPVSFTVPADSNGTLIDPMLIPDGFQFSIDGVAQVRYDIDQTSDFIDWTEIDSVSSPSLPVVIPAETLTGNNYFRVRAEGFEVPVEQGAPPPLRQIP